MLLKHAQRRFAAGAVGDGPGHGLPVRPHPHRGHPAGRRACLCTGAGNVRELSITSKFDIVRELSIFAKLDRALEARVTWKRSVVLKCWCFLFSNTTLYTACCWQQPHTGHLLPHAHHLYSYSSHHLPLLDVAQVREPRREDAPIAPVPAPLLAVNGGESGACASACYCTCRYADWCENAAAAPAPPARFKHTHGEAAAACAP